MEFVYDAQAWFVDHSLKVLANDKTVTAGKDAIPHHVDLDFQCAEWKQ